MIKDLGQIYKGADLTYSWNWNNYLTRKGTTASSSSWTTTSSSVSLSNAALDSGVASVRITGSSEGCAMIKNNVVFADGDDDFAIFKIEVIDPECEGVSTSDYD